MIARLSDNPRALMALIVVQTLCTAYFLWDVAIDLRPGGDTQSHDSAYLVVETAATFALVSALAVEICFLRNLTRRKARLEAQVSAASGAFHEVMQAHFSDWGFTPAERDVALFAIKGLSIAEIAAARGSAEGTVKSQLNAVYRKAGVSGRGALLGLLVDDLMAAPLVDGA